jgi:ribosomal protein S18 acetylase RimI-like enzyme
MDDYRIRKVTPDDFSFLADMIIRAEKGNSDKLSYALLLSLEENRVKELIISMLKEDIEGCEFSPSSYLIADYNGIPVAALGAWVEALNGNLPSKILKSNLLSFFLGKEQVQTLKSKSYIINDIFIERMSMTLQFEYLYVARAYRGRDLHVKLMDAHIANAFTACPDLLIAQAHTFENNFAAIKIFEEIGFRKVRSYKSDSNKIFDYLPHNVKILMEKDLTQITHG